MWMVFIKAKLAATAFVAAAVMVGCVSAAGAATAPVTIEYELDKPGQVSIAVYNADGRLVRTLRSGQKQQPGAHEVTWDGLDRNGDALPAGEYTWKLLRTPGFKAKLLGVVGVNPPELTNQWTGNHEGAESVFVKDEAMYVASGSTENVTSYLKMKLDGSAYVWEQSGPWGVPAGFGGGVRIAATDGVLYRLTANAWVVPVSAKTGSAYSLWPHGEPRTVTYYYKWDVKLPEQERQPWDGDEHQMDLDAHDGAVVVAYRDFDKLRWIDLEASPKKRQTGGRGADPAVFSRTAKIEQPRSIALTGADTALVLSNDRVVELGSDGSTRTVIPADQLNSPKWIDYDHDAREILVYQGSPRKQIVRFSSGGKKLRTYGARGGRSFGAYVPTNFHAVSDLTADQRGGFVVVETDLRRTAHFNRDGELRNQWYGGQNFFHFTSTAPDDPTRIFLGGGGKDLQTAGRIDYDTGEWRITDVYKQGELPLMPPTTWAHHQWHAKRSGDDLYLFTDASSSPALMRYDEKNNHFVAVARVGVRVRRDLHPALWEAAKKDGDAIEKRRRKFAAWAWGDRNGDGEPQPDEFTFSKARRNNIPAMSYNQHIKARHIAIDDELNLYFPDTDDTKSGHTDVAWYVMPNEAEPGDPAPKWDWKSVRPAEGRLPEQPARFGRFAGKAIHRDNEGNVYQMMADTSREGDKFPSDHTGRIRLMKWDNRGALQWSVGTHGTTTGVVKYTPKSDILTPDRVMFPARIMGDVNGCVVFADRWRFPATAWTKDGLYAGYFLDRRADDGLPERFYHWWRADIDNDNDSVIPTDCMVGGSIHPLPGGDVLWYAQGNQGNPVYRISGWDGWTRKRGEIALRKPAQAAAADGTGLVARFYDNDQFKGPPAHETALEDTELTRADFVEAMGDDDGKLPRRLSVLIEGAVEPPVSERWVFKADPATRWWDGHTRLWIDDQLILDTRAWDERTARIEGRKLSQAYRRVRAYSDPVTLTAGKRHRIKLGYTLTPPNPETRDGRRALKRQPDPPAHLKLKWQSRSFDRELIPTQHAYPAEAASR